MDENRGGGGVGGGGSSSSRNSSMLPASLRPTITLPSRSSVESLFSGGTDASPGPMTLVQNFFSENDPETFGGSFSQLLAGAISPPDLRGGGRLSSYPVSAAGDSNSLNGNKSDGRGGGGAGDVEFQFNNGRPERLVVSQQQSTFTVPPGLSPASLLDSPAFFLPTQGPFGMSHQQVLSRVTSQAAQVQTQMHVQPEYPSSSAAPGARLPHPLSFTSNATHQQMPPSMSDHNTGKEPSDLPHPNQRYDPSSVIADKPVEDGYNWRKYGQKQVKGSEYPRSYYKCTHPNCPVKKKVERSFEGQVTEIIYKGQHNHPQPQSKRGKETGNLNGTSGQFDSSQAYSLSMKDQESSQATHDHMSGSSDSEEVGNGDTGVDERNEDEPDAKRRNIEVRGSDPLASHRTEPQIIVQTTSEVDLLDDGYRWRKYGQKVVKGNPHPRSYYKCTSQGCNVRKHVERAASDPKAVITTYEGKHNHDVPAAKNSSHNIANTTLSQLRPPNTLVRRPEFLNNQQQQQIGLLQFKEEQTT